MSTPAREDLDAAIALLAAGLRGALEAHEAAGLRALPRPARVTTATAAPAGALRSALAPGRAPPLSATRPPESEGAAPARAPALPSAQTTARLIDVAPDAPPLITDPALEALVQLEAPAKARLERIAAEVVGDCRRCKLHRGRTNVVYGTGNPEAQLVFVGEGPGAEEDRQGVPFVGKAGQLLTKMIEAMGFRRDDVYICNVVKCRPPNNRDPEPDEVQACERFLKAQLGVLSPRVIVTLGKYAAQTLLRSKHPISQLRGQWAKYEGIDLLPTFHPAYLLRSPEKKREAWEDLQEVMRTFGKEPPARG